MHLSLLARVLWAVSLVECAALLAVLLLRRRWKVFPFFSGWIGFLVARTILLYLVYRFGTHRAYASTYWTAAVIDLALQIAIVFELARNVLKPTGTWVRDARRTFLIFAAVGTALAVAGTYGLNPSFPKSLDNWIEKGNLFAAMVNAELFAAILVSSSRLGLVWRHHVMVIATGWAAWAIVGLFVEGAYSYLHGVELDQFRIIVSLLVIVYWIINLWRSEPKTRTLLPDMQTYLQTLHKQVQFSTKVLSEFDKQ